MFIHTQKYDELPPNLFYVRTYVTHEYMAHYGQTCIANQNVFCLNIRNTRKYVLLLFHVRTYVTHEYMAHYVPIYVCK